MPRQAPTGGWGVALLLELFPHKIRGAPDGSPLFFCVQYASSRSAMTYLALRKVVVHATALNRAILDFEQGQGRDHDRLLGRIPKRRDHIGAFALYDFGRVADLRLPCLQ